MSGPRSSVQGWLGWRGALAVVGLGLAAVAARGAEPLLVLGARPGESQLVITQDEWAAELVDALGLSEALSPGVDERGDPEELFALLCPERAERVTDAGGLRVPARSPLHAAVEAPAPRRPGAPFRATVSLPAAALYLLSVEGVGAQRWTVDQRPIGHLDPSALGVAQAPVIVALRAGPHELAAYLTPRARVDRVELTAYRPLCLAPAEGWRTGRPLTAGAMARTLIHALGLERRLPEWGEAIRIEGEAFEEASAWGRSSSERLPVAASGDAWATAADSPAEFSYRLRLEEPGVFTIYARVHGAAPQIWTIDGRHRLTLRPGERAAALAWSHVLTLPLSAGEHVLRALMARGAGLDVIRLVRRHSADSDYVALAEREQLMGRAPPRRVTRSAASAVLSSPRFARRVRGSSGAAGLLRGFAGDPAEIPFALADSPPAQRAPPPLPPVLPGEL